MRDTLHLRPGFVEQGDSSCTANCSGVSLRLCYTLSANLTDDRASASTVAAVLRFLTAHSLIDDSRLRLRIDWNDGRPTRSEDALSPAEVVERTAALEPEAAQVARVDGLRTVDGFPNPFVAFTVDSEVLDGWFSVVYSYGTSRTRVVELVFMEPQFLTDTPGMSPESFIAELSAAIGSNLVPTCRPAERSSS